MLYLVAILLPPLPLILIGKPFAFVGNLIACIIAVPLTFVFGLGAAVWIGCIVWTWVALANRAADKRTDKLIRATRESAAANTGHGS